MSQTNAQLLADSLGTASTGTVPIGGIILWSGSTGSVPDGWALCNGSNGTPNLQDRFVVGAGSGYAVDATGGSADAVVVSHNHSITQTAHSHTYTRVDPVGNTVDGSPNDANPFRNTSTQSTSAQNANISIDTEGVSGTNANLPPYYALAYIMRTS